MNLYSMTGHLGKDAETRFTQGGMAICSFSVAVSYGYGDKQGTNWIRCSLFGKRAEGKLPEYLKKGQKVAITGELRVREYDDKDGNKRTSVELSVNTLDLIGAKSEAGDGNSKPNQDHAQKSSDPFADSPDFGDVPVDDDIPF